MLLLLGLLSLLTAADEVRHADAQHRATSDPSEGHAVKTGEREANLLGVADGDVDFTSLDIGSGIFRNGQRIITRSVVKGAEGDIGTTLVILRRTDRNLLKFCRIILIICLNGKGEGISNGIFVVWRLNLSYLVGTSIKALYFNLSFIVRRELEIIRNILVAKVHKLASNDLSVWTIF